MTAAGKLKKPAQFAYLLAWVLLLLLVFIGFFGHLLMPYGLTPEDKINFQTQIINGVEKEVSPPFAPSAEHWLGTDHRGYDMLSLLLNGAKYTLLFTLAVTITRFLFAVPFGLFAGATGKGRGVISTLQLITSSVPAILFVYPTMYELIRTFELNQGVRGDDPRVFLFTAILFLLLVAIGVFPLAHQFAERAKYYHGKLFVEASRTMGASTPRIVFRHLMPHLRPELLFAFLTELVQVLFLIGQLAILNIFLGGGEKVVLADGTRFTAEVSFLMTNSGEWGGMIAYSTKFIREFPWLLVESAGFLTVSILILLFFTNQLQKRLEGIAFAPRVPVYRDKKLWATLGTTVVACAALVFYTGDQTSSAPPAQPVISQGDSTAPQSPGTRGLPAKVAQGLQDFAKQFMSYVANNEWNYAEAFLTREYQSQLRAFPQLDVRPLIMNSCAECHGAQLDSGNGRANLRDTKLTAQQIELVIKNGTTNMPAGLLTNETEIEAMALYIKTVLQQNQIPQPFNSWFDAFQNGYQYVETGTLAKGDSRRYEVEIKVTDKSGQPATWKLFVVDDGSGDRTGLYRVDGIEGVPTP
ncbi:ABC-type dipeptide/oligopeptide/nickel transport system permease subunit [Tumebacillus sp. BK434]|uniref:c-type cytochrome n=1 Tax=Tumebacillus sp. BK434 TaxID=2512169 RepID=UPI001049C879|nr:c-type cytochrome [Tumebacillus sp. BK434]TCP59656.1 ABC-type dipeptide/oligopeptide/nickel transport system permease subunit [Tumebacillus sp. BK434]